MGEPGETRDDYGFIELKVDRQVDATRQLSGRAFLNTFRYDGKYVSDGVPSTDEARNEQLGAEVALNWDIASSNRLTVGGEARHNLRAQYVLPELTPSKVFNLPNTVLSAYLQDEHQVTRTLSILAGLRHDVYELSENATSPRLAAIFAPSAGSTFKLLYGSAFRAPSPYEAADGGVLYKANFELRPETAHTVEAVWQQRLATNLLGSVSLFHYDMKDLIDLTLDPGDGLYQYRNVGDAEADGFEVELQGRLGGTGTGYPSYSYQHATDRATGLPAHQLAGPYAEGRRGAGGDRLARHRVRQRATNRAAARSRAPRPTPRSSPTSISSFPRAPRVSARGSLDRLELSLRLNNVFDASFATPGGVEHRQAAIAQDGRNVSAELRYRF